MARPRKINKAKEPIRLRMKDLSNGNKSLYLDIYRAGKRSYEYLKMYLIPETDYNAKMQNQATLTAANAIKSKRIIEMINSEAGIKQETDTPKVYLLDWMETYMESQAKRGKKDISQIKKAIDILKAYGAETVTMDMIDKPFCQGYINYLTTEYHPKGKTVSNFTIHTYYQVVNGALNAAVRADILSENPFNKISSSKKIHKPESKREYMTIDEVRSLIKTPISNEAVKGAYLFSCFCGLRISDIKGLTWENVYCDSGQYRLEVMMQKKKSPLYLPLSSEALKWLPERGNKSGKEKVFKLPSSAGINKLLKTWAQKAGISKHITFCTARHTFATMMLTLGADIYTTSQLLGHTDMRTTQIYVKIVNRGKDEAVNLVNGLFE